MRAWGQETTELRLTGGLTVHTAADIRLLVHSAVDEGHGDLILDLGGVEDVDPTGLGVLVGAHRRAGRAGRRLVLRNVPPVLDRLLTVTRLRRILHIQYPVAA
jgi:anti-anti-sigma factor